MSEQAKQAPERSAATRRRRAAPGPLTAAREDLPPGPGHPRLSAGPDQPLATARRHRSTSRRRLQRLARPARPTALAAAAAAVAIAIAGCAAVGPDYQRPTPVVDSGFIAAGVATVNAEPTRADLATFWRGFNDPTLTALIEQAQAANGDVRIAQARLQEARANQAEADAAMRPGVGVDSGVTRAVTPIGQQPGASRGDRTGTTYDAGFVANWELDLFGRFRRGSEAAAARVDAGAANLSAAHTSVVAEVARNYLELRGLQQRLRIAESALVNQRDALRVTDARHEFGRGTRLDVERARNLVATTEAALPALRQGIERSVFRLATLTAQPPRALLAELAVPAALPGLPVTDLSTLPVGTPAQWLLRRPDLMAAERELAAATAGIGVAKTELYPRLSFSGLLGLNSVTLGTLTNGASLVYSLGAGLTWTPFDTGAIRGRIGAAEARALQSLVNYEQAVALAVEETEGAFSSYTRSAQTAERQAVAAGHAQEAARLARLRFSAGAADFLVVLDAERQALSSEDISMQAQTATATALVAVYRTLGGGWEAAPGRVLAIGSARGG